MKPMKARLISFALALALLGALLMLPGSAVAQTTVTNQVTDIPVTGTLPGGGTFTGTLGGCPRISANSSLTPG
jgi:hypothetical protein